jgi:hypothetical protein
MLKIIIQIASLLIGIPLQLLVIAALLRGAYRRFPFLFVYAILDFLTTVLLIPPAIDYALGHHRATNSLPMLYWPSQIIMSVVVYSVVMSLIYKATERLHSRRTVRTGLIVGAILIAAVSFAVHYDPSVRLDERFIWITSWNRDLNFTAAVLDLALWALLISQRQTDHRILLLSGGLGIQFAGDAIGSSITQLAIQNHSRPISMVGNVLTVTASLVFLYIWWQALRQTDEDGVTSPNAESATKAT